MNKRIFLEESRKSWAESAQHDKKQFLGSFALVSASVCVIGIGVKTIIDGDITGGTAAIAVGGGMSFAFGKEMLLEIQDYAEMTAVVAVRQSQLDQHEV
jgi:hypothetical protein